ncbi:hypothetical protein CUC00_08545 [Prevotella intermedia]|uniref:hypothetical protein n=1 Tax=Prevotella intermedia TaxID=28131 RepID=UPI000C1C4EEF|nr:hypothetical protein [Prevotella intermedia]ATV32516.1 hypothetical protein CTM44_01385 [Prevotella intermedia]ATV41072.1 hypothetical protein CUC00_08545 [Prevotella intermedia]
MKTYVITISKHFLTTHKRAGEETNFKEKFLNGEKIQTIRANYPLWEKRIKEVQEGRAALSIRQWTGKPYRSKQVEIARLTTEDGVGIQLLELTNDLSECIIGDHRHSYVSVAKNDGLHSADWLDWFSCYDLSKPMAIIHFTKFRY